MDHPIAIRGARPILSFFLLTFAVTWSFFIAAWAFARHSGSAVPGALVFLGTIAPAGVALVLAARNGAATALFRRVFQWQPDARWYLFALTYMAAIRVTVALTFRLITGAWPPYDDQPLLIVIGSILLSTPFQAGEEIGWRGYALPLLTERLGIAPASVVLGLIWACWHLPLFFLAVPGNQEYGQSFPVWALGVTALSVAFAWLYVHTKGSLLLTMLMHSAVNNIPHFHSSGHASLLTWLTALLLWIPAAFFLYRLYRAPRR